MRILKLPLTVLVLTGLALAGPLAFATAAAAQSTTQTVIAAAAAQTVTIRTAPDPAYQARVVLAHDHCRGTAAARTYPTMSTCVGDLAAPAPGNTQQADLWRTFLDCLSGWYKALDGMYPDPEADVNNCLERHGWDVQP